MIKIIEKKSKQKLPNSDYTFTTLEEYDLVLPYLTPKFGDNWLMQLIDPTIKEAKQLIDRGVPHFIDMHIYLVKLKLDNVLLENPSLAPKEISNKEAFLNLVAELNHPIDDNAMWHVYKVFNRNLADIEDALQKLDVEAQGLTITLKQVTATFALTERIYTSQVIRAFIMQERWRWNKLDKLVAELGVDYAYYSMRKQVNALLKDKVAYLENGTYKNRAVETIDAVSIDKLVILFAYSNNPKELSSILHKYDTFSLESLERR